VHCPEEGIVPAENAGLAVAAGEILLLVDDDVVVPPDWVARHLAHFADPRVGAVGGPFDNVLPDRTRLPRRAAEPLGRVTWYGRVVGNLNDHATDWRGRPPREVDHVAGGNLSLRRSAFDRFEAGLKRYWQLFELDACLQVKARGFRVLFDFANVVEHHPATHLHYHPGRDGDLRVKVFHAAYNRAYVLAKHSPRLLRLPRLLYLGAVGTLNSPGPLAFPANLVRHGNIWRELGILRECTHQHLRGWAAGCRARRQARTLESDREPARGAARGLHWIEGW